MEPLFRFKYGIIAIRPSEEEGMADILHFCGYENPPTAADFSSLREELANDEQLGLIEDIDNLILIEASPDIVDLYWEIVQTDPNWHEAN